MNNMEYKRRKLRKLCSPPGFPLHCLSTDRQQRLPSEHPQRAGCYGTSAAAFQGPVHQRTRLHRRGHHGRCLSPARQRGLHPNTHPDPGIPPHDEAARYTRECREVTALFGGEYIKRRKKWKSLPAPVCTPSIIKAQSFGVSPHKLHMPASQIRKVLNKDAIVQSSYSFK